jgi:hypothetical protein
VLAKIHGAQVFFDRGDLERGKQWVRQAADAATIAVVTRWLTIGWPKPTGPRSSSEAVLKVANSGACRLPTGWQLPAGLLKFGAKVEGSVVPPLPGRNTAGAPPGR